MAHRHGSPLFLILALALVFGLGHQSGDWPGYLGNPFLDAPNMFYPLRAWGFDQVRNGEIPLWNPLILCGMPNVAEMQSAIFYPPNLVFAFLPPARAYNACVILHLFLAGSFTYALLVYYRASRAAGLVAAVIYMFCGPQVTHLFAGHLTLLCVIAWPPLLVRLFDHAVRQPCWRAGMMGAGVLALQLLAGYPQCALYSVHMALALGIVLTAWTWRKERDGHRLAKRLAILAAGLGWGFALAAVQLLPAFEFVPHSVRAAFSREWTATHSLPPEHLLTLLMPGFFGVEQYWGREFLWETCGYVGVAGLVFALLAWCHPRRRLVLFFAALAAGSLLLALGQFSFLYPLVYSTVPGYSLFRGHAKYLVIAALALSVLAGLGLDSALAMEKTRLARAARALGLGGLALAAAFLLLDRSFARTEGVPEIWRQVIEWETGASVQAGDAGIALTWERMVREAGRSILFILLAAAWLGVASHRASSAQRIAASGFGLLLLDLAFFAWPFFAVTPVPPESQRPRRLEAAAPEDAPGWTRRPVKPHQPVNLGMSQGLATSEGYVGNLPAAYSEFFRMAEGDDPTRVDFTFRRSKNTPLSRLFAEAGPALGPPQEATSMASFPRAFWIAAPASSLPPRRPPEHDPDAQALPPRPSLWPVPVASLDRALTPVDLEQYGNQSVRIRVPGNAEGCLLLTDTYYPGWSARVDGRLRPVFPAYHAFRGVPARAGDQRIEFAYEPLSFRLGLAMSLFAAASWLGFLAARRMRRWSPIRQF
ncbi:MAG: YfhO family protein [Planctomycetes bacterium]|nr:YfhO family protein [Planctomycetota bacterium]